MVDETAQPEAEPAKPLLKVINSDATPEEVAAIVAVFSALGGGTAPAEKPKRSEWANPARQMRTSLPSSWRASSLPR
ncbi:acyl-CoA carboxylase subunit epsilon [Nocardioides sp. Kera G14]|uniref:acyl-CoA carboxylase subunit epsilon n=1 Tax=Nocardioides sp. Kera G14 TaxID=2884264 RepID=UPI001D11D8DF|nr:acyl-CoA carboxylase subunit epsilon [Nocardioides sp. Kera G14]UDY22773.1 acyl-CoA carboxylase subunit epsilon [Nocardioides sp. Kera G14]